MSDFDNNQDSQTGDDRDKPPWLYLLLIGLVAGTVLGWVVDDMRLGTAYCFMGALTLGALWRYFWPSLRRVFTRN